MSCKLKTTYPYPKTGQAVANEGYRKLSCKLKSTNTFQIPGKSSCKGGKGESSKMFLLL